MNDFCDLHTHSDYSLHDGFAKIDDKIKRAKELGYNALAMTEHGTTTGLMELYKKCKANDLKPILGYEGYFSFEPDVKGGNTYHIILLAKDLTGYRNLMKIATYGTEHFYRKPRIGYDILKQCHEGIICSTACVAGVLSSEEPLRVIEELKNIFNDDFYIEVQPHDFEEQYEYNKKVVELAHQTNTKVIVTGDSHYVWESDREIHRRWLGLAVDDSEVIERLENMERYQQANKKEQKAMRDKALAQMDYYGSGDYHMCSKEDMFNWFKKSKIATAKELNTWFDNVAEIINKCNVEIPLGGENYPVFDTKDPLEYIKKECRKGWVNKKINSKPNRDMYAKQVNHEFPILDGLNYTNYFCIIIDLLKWAKKSNIPFGVGRGSVGGSLVAYLANITDVDPILYNLVFERFANPERVTSPDIDLDFASNRRQDVIDYIKEKYGEVYQIRTISYIGDKSAVQRAGQVLKMTPSEIDTISKNITSVDEVKDKKLRELAKQFMGHIVSYGKHASAVVVFPRPVTEWCAIEKTKDAIVAAQDYHLLEEQGIMKLDILGLETLSVIDNTLNLIKENDGEEIDLSSIDYSDRKTGDTLRKGYTDGCFQIESKTMTDIIHNINTTNVCDLIDTVALGRPGVLDANMDKTFIKRRQGLEPVTYLHPKLEPILKDTEGVILYQEQIMSICRELCGYSMGEADNVRRVIGRKIIDEMQPIIDDILQRGVKNGIPKDTMQKICDEMVTFANYGFNRGHAAAYGITAWRTAWLKTHYPAQFYASLFDSVCSDKPKLLSHITMAKKMGLIILPPNIKLSDQTCRASGKYVLLGFNCISGVGNTTVENSDFDKIADPFQWINIHSNYNKTVLSNLVKAGCFDDYTKKSRFELLEYITWTKDKRKSKGEFVYTGEEPEPYGNLEFEVMGYAFTDIFSGYDLSIVDNIVNFAILIANVKATKTKKGKPMAFVKAMGTNGSKELVIFDKSYEELEKGQVYIMRLDDTIIKDFTKAKRVA